MASKKHTPKHTALLQTFIEGGYAKKTARIALALIAIGVLVGVAVIAPNVLQVLGSRSRQKKTSRRDVYRTLIGLQRHGYVYLQKSQRYSARVLLTEKGEQHVRKCAIEAVGLGVPKHWDRKWRFVLFDISSDKTAVRNALRRQLQQLGFLQYQKSVWVHPAPCEEEIIFLRDYFRVYSQVRIVCAKDEDIEGATRLKTYFELS